jgi:CheY-like chemotaxis protein
MPVQLTKSDMEVLVRSLVVLVIDDNQFMRKTVRNLLLNIGIKEIYEANDGVAGLDAVRTIGPNIVILDWEMPLLNGPEFVRIVRSPGVFPMSDIPIIMLSSYGERSRVIEAMRLGVNEYLRKPVSAQQLLDRFISILAKPRATVQVGNYYGPEPRRLLPGKARLLDVAPPPRDTKLN